MKRRTPSIVTTLKINFVLAVTTAFVLLAMYSLDYANNNLGTFIDKQVRDYEPKSLEQRQADALAYLYNERD